MKTLVNKQNPHVRITAPEIELVHTEPIDYWRVREVGCFAANAWELKEEETIVETIKEFVEKGERCMEQAVEDQNPGNYTFWDGFHNCAENILREVEEPTEEIKGNLEEIPSNVNLEKAAEEYADKHGFRVPYDGSNNFYDDVDVKASLEGFKEGAKWMAEQGITYKDKVMPTTDNKGNVDGYCLDGENEFAAVEAAVENGYLKVGDKVIVQIRKAE